MENNGEKRWQRSAAEAPKAAEAGSFNMRTRLRVCRDGVADVLRYLPKAHKQTQQYLQFAWINLDRDLETQIKQEPPPCLPL